MSLGERIRILARLIPWIAALCLVACKKGSETNAFAAFLPIPAASAGTNGCNGPDQTFAAPVPVYADPSLGATSQLAAAQGEETLFFTGADGSVRALDFSGGAPPVETILVAGGVGGPIDQLLLNAGIAQPSELSGIAVLDPTNLVVVEHTSNTLLLVSRITPDGVAFLVGFPDVVEGFADGTAGQARFSFPAGVPTGLAPTGDGRIFVADAGNHALREVDVGALSIVLTVAGSGAPTAAPDGSLTSAGFDTPAGVSVSCGGRLVVTETGGAGVAGRRLRSIEIGAPSFFGGLEGSVETLVGNLDAPRGPVTSSGDEIYWVDTGTGILRRYVPATGISDCPPFVDCASASASFTPGSAVSLAISDSGVLYALDGDAGTLYRVTP